MAEGICCLPSRGRPKSLQRFLDAYLETGATAPVYVRLDDDDPLLADYTQIGVPANWIVAVRPRHPTRCNGAIEEMFERWPDAAFYGLLSDDVVPRTFAWDRKLIEAAGRTRLAYGDDGLRGENLATHPFVGGDLARAIGWLVLPGLSHSFVDTALFKLAQLLDLLTYLPEVRVEHLHPLAGKAPIDETYRFNDAALFAQDRRVFSEWFNGDGVRDDIARVCKALD